MRKVGTSGKMVPWVAIPDEAIKKFKHKVRGILAPQTSKEACRAKVIALNSLIRGWCQYYCCTNSASREFNKLGPEVYWGLAHWLGRKYKIAMPEVMRRYQGGHTLKTKTWTLVMPDDIKAKKRRQRTWHNPYTEPEKVEEEKDRLKRERLFSYEHIWNGTQDRKGQMDLREELLLLKGPVCAKCRKTFHPSELETDHIIARKRFKDPTDADELENTQLLCTVCFRQACLTSHVVSVTSDT
jgi:5-methylcytosine-specific restriction endonuclease McrA